MNRAVPAALVLALSAMTPAWSQAVRGGSEVRGRVLDARGRALAGALVVRDGSPDSARADSAGRFAIVAIPLGRSVFTVRHLGYHPSVFEIEVQADTTISLDVPLEPAALVLDSITIRGEGRYNRGLRAVGFEERRVLARRTATDATFITPEDIERRHAARLSHLLDGHRGIHIRYQRSIWAVPYGRDGRCVMHVWLDGQEIGMREATGLDAIDPNQIAGIEIYPSPTGMPPQFQSLTRICGAIVIWSKQ